MLDNQKLKTLDFARTLIRSERFLRIGPMIGREARHVTGETRPCTGRVRVLPSRRSRDSLT